MDTVFQGALTDSALFHALSLSLALAANNNEVNIECLTYRGELMKHLGGRMSDASKVAQERTLTAILLLIGYQVRAGMSRASLYEALTFRHSIA
jgi:hypothetical protein